MRLIECFIILIAVVVVIFLFFNFSESFEKFRPQQKKTNFFAIGAPKLLTNMAGGADASTSTDASSLTTNDSKTSVTGESVLLQPVVVKVPAKLAPAGQVPVGQAPVGKTFAGLNLPSALPADIPEQSDMGKYVANIQNLNNDQIDFKKKINRPSKVMGRCEQVANYYLNNNLELAPELIGLPISEVYDKMSSHYNELNKDMHELNCLNKGNIFNTQGFRLCDNNQFCDEPTGVDLNNNWETM